MTKFEDPKKKAERIAASRAALAAAYAADPAAVQRFEARKARLAAAQKRERERFEILVLGGDRPEPIRKVSRQRGKRRVLKEAVKLAPDIERALSQREQWSHKTATPQTLGHGIHCDSLDQLERNGTITKEQRESAAQIANVHRSIESEVAVKGASLEARVDNSARPPAIGERIHRVRMHLAYSFWRRQLALPKGLVLDMIVGDTIGYSVAARRYRVHKRKAKRLLLQAIESWPACVAAAFSVVDQGDVDRMNDARAPYGYQPDSAPYRAPAAPSEATAYDRARDVEAGRDRTDEPFLLPPIDPAFFDDRGFLLSFAKIADIIRERWDADVDQVVARETA